MAYGVFSLIFIFLQLLFVPAFSVSSPSPSTVSFHPCGAPSGTWSTSPHSITWSTKSTDASASVIDYRICGQRSRDLRYVTHLRVVHWSDDQPIMDRQFAICDGTDVKRQACIDQLAQSPQACLSGSVVLRLPVFTDTPDGRTRTEVRVSEGATGTGDEDAGGTGATIFRFCSPSTT